MAILQPGESRDKALAAVLEKINKEFGKNSIFEMGDAPIEKIPVYSTGSLALDVALGVGGIPQGRVIEIYGPESSGKTTLTLSIARSVQAAGGIVAFIDAEHALDPAWASKIGVNIDKLVLSQPDTGEQALQEVDLLVNSGAVDLIIVDSVAALVPKKELEGEMGDSHVGLQARLMSQGLRKMTAATKRNNTTVIFINQLREKIGVMFGSPETTTGGKALKFYASVRLDIRKKEGLKIGEELIGNKTKVKVVKNKVAPPFKEAEPEIMYGINGTRAGFSREGDLIDMGVKHGVIKKAGAWYSMADGRQIGQGKEKSREELLNVPELADEIDAAIRAILLPEAIPFSADKDAPVVEEVTATKKVSVTKEETPFEDAE